MTVLETYHLLETRGIAVSRTRSGYFVKAQAKPIVPQPTASPASAGSMLVDKSELIFDVLNLVKRDWVVPLGSAFPSPLRFSLPRPYRSLRRALRNVDPWRTVADLTPGSPDLRCLIAVRYGLDGIRNGAEDLVMTDGAMAAGFVSAL